MATIVVAIICSSNSALAAEDSGFVSFRTASGRDTLVQGLHECVRIEYALQNDTLVSFLICMLTLFSGANTLGPLYDTGVAPNVHFSDFIEATWPSRQWDLYSGLSVTSPDSLAVAAFDVNVSPPWVGAGLLLELCVCPIDTGTIQFVPAEPANQWSSFGNFAGEMIPTRWITPILHVVACEQSGLTWGDAKRDGSVNSADVIFLVNHVFKMGIRPVVFELGDLDCSSAITSTDIIYLINFVFKSGNAPCDPCAGLGR